MTTAEPRIRLSLRSFAAVVDTEAVVQETLLRCWQVAPTLVGDGGEDPLLRMGVRIARNLSIDHARRARVVVAEPGVLEDRAATTPIEPDPHLRAAIAGCREKLPARPARALAQRLMGHSMHDSQLAARAGMQLNTFLKNVSRARSLLKACLRRAGIDVAAEVGS